MFYGIIISIAAKRLIEFTYYIMGADIIKICCSICFSRNPSHLLNLAHIFLPAVIVAILHKFCSVINPLDLSLTTSDSVLSALSVNLVIKHNFYDYF